MSEPSLLEQAAQSRTAFDSVPIIDLTNATSPDPALRRQLAAEIRDACINVGFFYVRNHDIPDACFADVLAAMKSFYGLPIEKKMELENKKQVNFMGYSPLLSGNNDPSNSGDLQEGFEFGYEALENSTASELGNTIIGGGKNVWPTDGLPQFRESALKYYHAALSVGRRMFPLFALALGLEENFFEDKTRNSAALMRLLYYPPQTAAIDENKVMGIGAHTDWECFTILWQEPKHQALQVLNSEKQWISAPPIEGTLVINLGDQFARWTNDIFKSTVHRAINRNGVDRYAIPLFFGTDYDVRLEPIPGCVSAERPAKYEVITAGDYVQSRLQATYGH
ncbi:hypothetical protein BD626DRAFT_631280 [Schizophyllum amplum]|uniref:Fe2OG dioxygenase domain-containing protein n=1 Tax=Schizophyllum amplum TaxID=97359 RepID=A0A550CBD4_9AGAR|nr:hypothetical protein BD626DRAFT_631280 [Auriculariopsis ampla]